MKTLQTLLPAYPFGSFTRHLQGTPVGQMSYVIGGRTQGKSYFENCFVENKDRSLGYCFDIECDSSFTGCFWDEAELIVEAARRGGKTETLMWQEYFKLAAMFPSYVYKMSKGKQPRFVRVKI